MAILPLPETSPVRYLVAGAVLISLAFARSLAADAVPLVGVLERSEMAKGCSWSASRPDGASVFTAEIDGSVARMRIDGKLMELKPAGPALGSIEKVGSHLHRTYVGGGIVVAADFTVSWVCPDDSENCEVARFDVRLDVRSGSRRELVTGTGERGC